MLDSLQGLDHLVLMVEDLDDAARAWHALGFTLSPRGTHSQHLGTGNYTLMFEQDYLELLGILQPTAHNAPSRDFLTRRGAGIECVAMRTTDAQAGVHALQQRGIKASEPLDFSRPVTLDDGSQSEAAFSIFNWPVTTRPADVRLFACQHHTPDTVWLPSLTQHANTVTGMRQIDVIAPEISLAHAAELFAQCIDTQAVPDAAGMRIETGHGKADIVFTTREHFAHQYQLDPVAAFPTQGAAAIVFDVHDLEEARRHVGQQGHDAGSALVVPPTKTTGVTLVFTSSDA